MLISLKRRLAWDSPWAQASLLALVLLVVRVVYTGQYTYAFLGWNLFLAWIPWGLSRVMRVCREPYRWLIGGLWLLFLPNAPYILTDLFHLRPKAGVPLWFDLILILSFAWGGLVAGYASLWQVQHMVERKYGRRRSGWFAAAILLLSSYGVYLGRYLRWNSWDMITHPLALLQDVMAPLTQPFSQLRAIGFTLLFGLFLWITYRGFVRYTGAGSVRN